MKQNDHRIIGIILISLSGFFFTAERIAERVGVAYSGVSMAYYPGFFDNFFVWFFFILGFMFLAKTFLRSVMKNYYNQAK